MILTFKPMNDHAAKEVISWRYDGNYSIYNLTADDLEEEVQYMTNPDNHFFAIYDGVDLIGHAVFHSEGRVPGGDYSADALDVGAGMQPDSTGKGRGAEVIAAILDFAREYYQPEKFRATIAAWNIRAQKATTKNGFKEVSRFKKTGTEREFIIFMRDA